MVPASWSGPFLKGWRGSSWPACFAQVSRLAGPHKEKSGLAISIREAHWIELRAAIRSHSPVPYAAATQRVRVKERVSNLSIESRSCGLVDFRL